MKEDIGKVGLFESVQERWIVLLWIVNARPAMMLLLGGRNDRTGTIRGDPDSGSSPA